jgi:hypothetical protein
MALLLWYWQLCGSLFLRGMCQVRDVAVLKAHAHVASLFCVMHVCATLREGVGYLCVLACFPVRMKCRRLLLLLLLLFIGVISSCWEPLYAHHSGSTASWRGGSRQGRKNNNVDQQLSL